MKFRGNYKIENDGIWISKKELKKWLDLYKKYRSDGYSTIPQMMYYSGKCDMIIDILKTFEERDETEK